MEFLRDQPLRKKLIGISLIASGITMLLIVSGLLFYDLKTNKPRVIHNLEALSDLYNATLPATLYFNDPKAATENLQTMEAQREVRLSCVYRIDGTFFANYVRSSEKNLLCPKELPKNNGHQFKGANLLMYRSIVYSEETVGYLLIEYALPSLFFRIMQYATILAVVMLSLFFTSLLFIAGFEKNVIDPILKLERVARQISEKKDHKLRAPKYGQDEIGSLTDAFNQMLGTIDQVLSALSESESRFRRVSESNMIGIIFTNLDGRIIEANDYFLQTLGYSRQELIDQKMNWAKLTPPEYAHLNERAINELKAKNVFTPFEKEYFRKDGKRVTVLIGGAFLQGSKTEIVDFVLDVTQRKQAEKEIELLLSKEHKTRIEAEEALQLREDFMSIAAHELRTPLTPLKLQLDFIKTILRKEPALFPKIGMISKMMTSADQQINRLSHLIEDMLDVSRIRTGRFTLSLEKVDLTELVQSVVQRYQMELEKLKIELKLKIEEHLVGCWDRLRIEQILINLLTNAIKYGERKAIEITVSPCKEGACLIVTDHGIGITEKDQSRIFNRFERAVSTQNFGGLGLGLYITRQIVEAHNGHISVVSRPGEGSSFIVELPLMWPLMAIEKKNEFQDQTLH